MAVRTGVQRRVPRAAFAVAIGAGIGTWAWMECTKPAHSVPSKTHFASLTVQSTTSLPPTSLGMFDPSERPMHKHLHLEAHNDISAPNHTSNFGIYAYYVKEPTIQVERPYTPLSMLHRADPKTLDLLVKRYRDGEVSRFLHRLSTGTEMEMRGPEVSWHLPSSARVPDEIVTLVGGTGVAATHQLLSNVLDTRPSKPPKLTVWYAAPTMDALQVMPELVAYAKAFPNYVSLRVFVERMPPKTQGVLFAADGGQLPVTVETVPRSWWQWLKRPSFELVVDDHMHIPLHHGRITQDDVQKHLAPAAVQRIILVCGPDGFVRALAGPKGRDLVSQGPLQGMLAAAGYAPCDVFKM